MVTKEVRPPLNWIKIIFEIIASIVLVIILAPLYVAAVFFPTPIMLILLLLLSCFFLSITVYLIGSYGRKTGSFWKTFLGTISLLVLAVGINWVLSFINVDFFLGNFSLNALLIVIFPILGAVLGFNLTRKYKRKKRRDKRNERRKGYLFE